MDRIAAVVLGVFLMTVGVAHFALPGYFRTLVPHRLPRPALLVAASGVAEVVVGALVLVPESRAVGGWVAAVLISGYLVSHLDALRHARADHPRLLERPSGAIARLCVNLCYIGWAVWVAQSGRPGSQTYFP